MLLAGKHTAILAMLLLGAQTVYAEDDIAICELKVNFCHSDVVDGKAIVARTYNADDDVTIVAYDALTIKLHNENTVRCHHSHECILTGEIAMGIGASDYQHYGCNTRVFVSVLRELYPPYYRYYFSTEACVDVTAPEE